MFNQIGAIKWAINESVAGHLSSSTTLSEMDMP